MDRRSLSILLALAFFAALALSLWQLFITNTGEDTGLEIGQPMPEFAAPLAGSGLDADSNIAQRADADTGRAACEIHLTGAFNSCDHERLAVMFWLRRGGECIRRVDVLSSAAGRHRGVKVAAVAVGESIESATKLARERGWKIDIPVDRDRAAALLYRVIGCPTFVTSYRGTIVDIELGQMTAQKIDRQLERLSQRSGGALGATDG